jgi:hypothetical protein
VDLFCGNNPSDVLSFFVSTFVPMTTDTLFSQEGPAAREVARRIGSVVREVARHGSVPARSRERYKFRDPSGLI